MIEYKWKRKKLNFNLVIKPATKGHMFMAKILILGMNDSFLQKMAQSADQAGFETSTYLTAIGWTQSLERNCTYDVISVVTDTRAEKRLIRRAIDILREIRFNGVLVHYWGHSPVGEIPSNTSFQFTELMQQCYGSPECPLTGRWADLCLTVHKEHSQEKTT